MDRTQAEENISVIREIMERSARYTNLSGISGIIAGLLALFGCWFTYWIYFNTPLDGQNTWYMITWITIFFLALGQDFFIAQRKAKRRGETFLTPATYQVFKAVLPGILIAFALSFRAMLHGDLDVIPAIWTLGYGVAVCAAGSFSVKEVKIFGAVQLLTGIFGLFFLSDWYNSMYMLGLSFGVYHILFGIWMSKKYGW